MALALFPTPAGLAFPVSKTPMTSSRAVEAASGVGYRAQNWSYPRWKFSLNMEFLRQYASYQEWSSLTAFILSQAGMFGNWCFNDTTDNTATTQQIGTGNGAQVSFPLVRTISAPGQSYIEPVLYCHSLNAVYFDGAIQAGGYSLSQTGFYGPDTLVFSNSPPNGVSITASFNFYFVCRFLQDDPEFKLFIGGRWGVDKLDFESVK